MGNTADRVTLNLNSSAANENVIINGDNNFFSLTSFEVFDVTGSAGDDRITTLGGNDIIRGGDGNDTIFCLLYTSPSPRDRG